MDIDLSSIFTSIWQVLAVGLLLGAGLPALYSLGMRALATTPAGFTVDDNADHVTAGPLRRTVAYTLFALCAALALFGVLFIIFGKTWFGA